jgi:Flp pilus assembly protein TadD
VKLAFSKCVLLLLLFLAVAAAAADDLAGARKLLLSGKYAEAEDAYRPLAKKDFRAALGLARSQDARGMREAAAKTLAGAPDGHAEIEAELARLAFERGDYKAAEKHVEAARKLDHEQLQAAWLRGELFRVSGRLEQAAAAYHELIDFYNGHEVKDAESLRWIGLAAAEYARWKRLNEQFSIVVNDLCPDALQAEPDYWPAHYEAGRLYLEKYNQADADREFKAALAENPNAAEVLVALAELALEDHDPHEAQQLVARALEINPQLIDAWQVKADLAWANFDPAMAAKILQERALPLDPLDEESLGRLAACYVVEHGPSGNVGQAGGDARLKRLIDRVLAQNPHPGVFFETLASWLDDRNRTAEAEHWYREAIQRMPQHLGPRAKLGLMWMRVGQEAEAHRMLEEAFREDPFHVRVKNTLELLDVIETMQTVDTGHCLLRFDGSRQKHLARYAAPHVERVFQQLAEKFGYRPPGKPLVEIFSRAKGIGGHEWFSTRMIGLPYLGTVAACTGPMIGLTAPSDSPVPFNWARVLRHEMTHVVTLQQTGYNVPHWYTEALAVWCEGYPRPPQWNELLVRRVQAGKLFTLDTINFAFTSPNSGDDWQMAYCQAELYVEYMLQGRGEEVLRKLLDAYTENLSTAEGIRRVFGMSQEKFEQGYVAYLKKLAAELSRGQPPERELEELLRAQRADPKNAELAAEMADAYLRRGALAEARQLAAKAVGLRAGQPLAGYVLARLAVRDGKVKEAEAMLAGCLRSQPPDPRALELLASLKLKDEAYAEAEPLYEQGATLQPHDARWLRALAVIYAKSKEERKLVDALTRLAKMDSDNLSARKELARLALQKRDYALASQWANQGLEIDVSDGELHSIIAEAAGERHNQQESIEEYEIAVELSPTDPRPRLGLADVYVQAGKTPEARRVLGEFLKVVPDQPAAKLMLESLK